MLSSYSVACPHQDCTWTGNVIPSLLQDGASAEIVSGKQAWFQCPRCQRAWEVRISADEVQSIRDGEQFTNWGAPALATKTLC